MIAKAIDPITQSVDTLKSLLASAESPSKKKKISQHLRSMQNGFYAEKGNGYYLNYNIGPREDMAVIHDIRLEHKGQVAQFDHIVISRYGIYLLESKALKGEMKINKDNSFTVQYSKNVKNFPSPVEQNKRHILCLRAFLKDKIKFKSARFKWGGGISIRQKVLLNTDTKVVNKKLPKNFSRADTFFSIMQKEDANMNMFASLHNMFTELTPSQVEKIASVIVKNHTPIEMDYAGMLGVDNLNQTKDTEEIVHCPKCASAMVLRTSKKGKNAGSQFWGCSSFPKCNGIRKCEDEL